MEVRWLNGPIWEEKGWMDYFGWRKKDFEKYNIVLAQHIEAVSFIRKDTGRTHVIFKGCELWM